MESTRRERRGARRPAFAVVCVLAALLVAGCSGRTTGATIVTDTTARLNAVGSCDANCQVFMRYRKAGTSAWTNAPVINVGKATDVP